MPVGELDDHPGVAANGLEVCVQCGKQQIVRLFNAADGSEDSGIDDDRAARAGLMRRAQPQGRGDPHPL